MENHGDNDAAPENQPSQFLLFRGLESSVTEELLAKGVAKLYRPTNSLENPSGNQKKGAKVASTTGDANLGARDGSIRRVLLVRDRRTNESWRYGFAEFATVQVCLLCRQARQSLTVIGCTSCHHAVELVRQIYHFLEAGPSQLHTCWCFRARYQPFGQHGPIHIQPIEQFTAEAHVLGR